MSRLECYNISEKLNSTYSGWYEISSLYGKPEMDAIDEWGTRALGDPFSAARDDRTKRNG